MRFWREQKAYLPVTRRRTKRPLADIDYPRQAGLERRMTASPSMVTLERSPRREVVESDHRSRALLAEQKAYLPERGAGRDLADIDILAGGAREADDSIPVVPSRSLWR